METDIELLARAPFSFWGNTRYETPISLDSEPVLQTEDMEKPIFSNRFIYLVTRENIIASTMNSSRPELMRHGGCPVLHRDFKTDALIQRTGDTYLKFYEKLSMPEVS